MTGTGLLLRKGQFTSRQKLRHHLAPHSSDLTAASQHKVRSTEQDCHASSGRGMPEGGEY